MTVLLVLHNFENIVCQSYNDVFEFVRVLYRILLVSFFSPDTVYIYELCQYDRIVYIVGVWANSRPKLIQFSKKRLTLAVGIFKPKNRGKSLLARD